MVQWITGHAPNARGPGLILGQGTRSHTLQLSLSTTHSRNGPTQLEKLAETQRNQKKRGPRESSDGIILGKITQETPLGIESSSLDAGGKQSKARVCCGLSQAPSGPDCSKRC